MYARVRMDTAWPFLALVVFHTRDISNTQKPHNIGISFYNDFPSGQIISGFEML